MFDPAEDGAMVIGWFDHTAETNPKGGPKRCYYDVNGHMLYGQRKIDGYWYMFHPSSGAMMKGFYHHTNATNPKGGPKTCYYDAQGHMLYGQRKLGGYWYMFHPSSGAMIKGWYNHTDATNPKGGPKRCYYDANGHMLYGQRKLGGYWYMFHPSSGAMIKGWYNHTDATNPKGGPKTCYYDANGHMVYGQRKIDGYWYMFHPSSGAMNKGWYNHTEETNPKGGPKRVYYDAKGRMVYGKQEIDGSWYKFHEQSGALLTGKDHIAFDVPQLQAVAMAKGSRSITTFGGLTLTDAQKSKLQSALNASQSNGRKVGFLLVDIKTGQGVAYDPDRTFYSASTIKGPYVAAMTYFYPESVNKRSGQINNVLVNSSNSDYATLANTYGKSCITKWAKEGGISSINWRSNSNYAWYNARTLARLWLVNYGYFTYDTTGKQVSVRFGRAATSPIRSTLGGKYSVRTKAGWTDYGGDRDSANDAGIVYASNGAYVLAIMSNHPAQLSKLNGVIKALDEIHQTL